MVPRACGDEWRFGVQMHGAGVIRGGFRDAWGGSEF